MNYWLLKTEPNLFSIDDLQTVGIEPWDGIRNYQARNFLRDSLKPGDKVFIYHSREQPIGIAGEAEVASAGYPDPTQFQPDEKYYDPKSDPTNPRWYLVDIKFARKYPRVLTLPELKTVPELAAMVLVQKGSRLSVQPVQESEWRFIQTMVATL
jgi:predicted RNA-binding protein with PUA-like domain